MLGHAARAGRFAGTLSMVALLAGAPPTQETLTLDTPQCAGLSGFRAHWDQPIAVAENGERLVKDGVVKDRGQTAVWGGGKPGPLAFDAVHRSLLVRFPGAAEKIAAALAGGKAIEKVELVLPYLDEEIWPAGSGGADYPSADGYRYRPNWDCDKLYRERRPNWHALASVLRRPWQAAEHPFGQRKVPAQEIRSVQGTAALFNFESPKPTWNVFIDDQKVGALPAAAKYGQVVLIHDGVSYLAIRPLPTDDLGRDVEIGLEAGQPQIQPYHENTRIQPALLINACFYRRNAAIGGDAMKRLETAQTGFVVEMGDAAEHGSFEKFRARIRAAKLGVDPSGVTYRSGPDTLAAGWDAFTVNGQDPYARMLLGELTAKGPRSLRQDTPVSQMGKHRLEKNGAVVERGTRHPELAMFLHAFPAAKLYAATNPTPCCLDFGFREPGGVEIVADGACSMGRWGVRDSREIDLSYHPFGGDYRPAGKDVNPASVLFVAGAKARPKVTLNDRDVTAAIKAWKQDGTDGWLVPLNGAFPKDDEVAARLRAARAAIGAR